MAASNVGVTASMAGAQASLAAMGVPTVVAALQAQPSSTGPLQQVPTAAPVTSAPMPNAAATPSVSLPTNKRPQDSSTSQDSGTQPDSKRQKLEVDEEHVSN